MPTKAGAVARSLRERGVDQLKQEHANQGVPLTVLRRLPVLLSALQHLRRLLAGTPAAAPASRLDAPAAVWDDEPEAALLDDIPAEGLADDTPDRDTDTGFEGAGYESRLRRLPRLSLDEELALGRRAREGDEASAERLILHNLHIVPHLARRFSASGMTHDDLVEEGNLGLMHAVTKFDPDRGLRLSTYASWWVLHMMRNALMNQSRTVRLPTHVVKRLGVLRRKLREIEAADCLHALPPGHTGSALERASSAVGLDLAASHRLMSVGEPALSLDEPLDPEGERGMADQAQPAPEVLLVARQRLALIVSLVNALPRNERVVINGRFGMDGGEPQTLEAIASKLNLSAERVRQLQNIALAKLRSQFEQYGIVLSDLI
jgi:RNA polymerase nonessential primary-like sigma factor